MIIVRILKHELAWRLWLFLIIFLQLIFVSFCYDDRYCGNVDIRTSTKYGDPHISYENCTVVEGNVIIAVYNDSSIDDSAFATFKRVRVVTGFIVVFFTENLRSVSRVFPNLRIIGGDDLIDDYSLIIYSNTGLYDIGLSKLTAILNGGIYSASNGNLCYVRSVNWNKLLEATDRHIYIDEGSNLKAEPCNYDAKCNKENSSRCLIENGKSMCWNKASCQKVCEHDFDIVMVEVEDGSKNTSRRIRGPGCDDEGRRCHEQCLGGCFAVNDPRSCYYCKNVVHEGKCIENCPAGMFELKVPRRIRRCVSEEDCRRISSEVVEVLTDVESLHIVDDVCQVGCPAGMEEDDEDPYKCKKCANEKGCVKQCTGDFLLHDGAELKRLFYGECEIIDGNLEIELTDKVGYYMAVALDEALSRIKVITGYLIIRFSTSLTSLRSFKRLERIDGRNLYQNRFALAVFDNKNLVELLDTEVEKRLVIDNGTIQFQNNPQLCYDEIMKLVRYANLQNSSVDASPFSNGDQAICDKVNLTVWTAEVTHNSANIFWEPMDLNNTDHRKLLGYQIYYTEASDNKSEINIYEGRSACDDKWRMKFHPNLDEELELGNVTFLNRVSLNETIQNLSPFKWYAYYVQTKVVKHNGSRQGFSKVEFFRTKPYKPGEPDDFQYKASANEIKLGWRPPVHENGIVTHYIIEMEEQDDSYFIHNTAVCDLHGQRVATLKSALFKDDSDPSSVFSLDDIYSGTCKKISSCCKCNQDEERKDNFQDTLATQREIEKHERRVSLEADVENKIQDKVFFDKDSGRQRRDLPISPPDKMHIEEGYERCNIENDYYGDITVCNIALTANRSLIHKFKVNKLRAVIRGLKHYTYFKIKVYACQSTTEESRGYCSQVPANATIRTPELVDSDFVTDIQVVSTNSSERKERMHTITWKEVENPNGATLAYEVRLTPVGTDKADSVSKCVNATEFRHLKSVLFYNLAEGSYVVSVQPITTAVINGSVVDNISRMKGLLVVKEPVLTLRTALKLLLVFSLLLAIASVLILSITSKTARKWVFGKEALLSFGFIDEEDDEYKPDDWDIDRNKIEFIKKIGAGRFGEVFYAKPLPDSGYSFTECAVKRSPLTDDTLSRKHFIAEGQLMKNFDTTFIIKLYGISAGKGQPALIFLEYMEKGNLRDLLRERRCKQEQEYIDTVGKTKYSCRHGYDGRSDTLTPVSMIPPKKPYSVGYGNSAVKLEQCFLWGVQIADAMAYLEAYQFVHRDLAARNILVDGKENVKLGDFGLTRDVYYHEYYRPSGARPLPVRWMSPETMRDGIFTSKSDVWSYGIVLYEIFTLGERPYPHVDNDLVFDYVEKRNVNKKPLGCPSFWYDLMLECWHFQPNSRPSFAEIVTKLLPFVEDPEFIKVSFTCNTAKNVAETGKITFHDKNVASEKKQEDFVRMRVQEQQKTDACLEKEERLRRVEQTALRENDEPTVSSEVKHWQLKGGAVGKPKKCELHKRNRRSQQASTVANANGRRKNGGSSRLQNQAKVLRNSKNEDNGDVVDKKAELKREKMLDRIQDGEYIEGLPPWNNGPVCKSNRRPNGVVKSVKKVPELKALQNGLGKTSIDQEKQFQIINSMGNLGRASKPNEYSRITIEEDSV